MLQAQVKSVPVPMPIKVEQLADLVKSWLRGLGFEPGVVLQTAAQTGAPPPSSTADINRAPEASAPVAFWFTLSSCSLWSGQYPASTSTVASTHPGGV